MKKIIILFVIGILLHSCIAPNNAYLMELNREGKWNQVTSIGKDMIQNRSKFTFSEISETYFHVSYAFIRLKDNVTATRFIEDYEKWRRGGSLEPEFLWLNREMFFLKKEIGLLDDVELLLSDAMTANGNQEYNKAIKLAKDSLELSGITDQQSAYAYFLLSVCSYRLNEIEEAVNYLDFYSKFRMSLPEDDQLRYEEHLLYKDLGIAIP
jgi:hypothetical protein